MVLGALAGRRPGQFPTSGSRALLDTGPDAGPGRTRAACGWRVSRGSRAFVSGTNHCWEWLPTARSGNLPPSGVSQGWRMKPVGSGVGRGEAGALGPPCPQAPPAEHRGPTWGWVASLTAAPTAGLPHPSPHLCPGQVPASGWPGRMDGSCRPPGTRWVCRLGAGCLPNAESWGSGVMSWHPSRGRSEPVCLCRTWLVPQDSPPCSRCPCTTPQGTGVTG